MCAETCAIEGPKSVILLSRTLYRVLLQIADAVLGPAPFPGLVGSQPDCTPSIYTVEYDYGNAYYSFNTGSAHVIFLSSYSFTNITSKQYLVRKIKPLSWMWQGSQRLMQGLAKPFHVRVELHGLGDTVICREGYTS